MFTNRHLKRSQNPTSFKGEKCLINKLFKYKSLGEMVAMARATGVAPVPTRNGVYTGDQEIPRDTFEKVNLQRKLMDSYDEANQALKTALETQAKQDKQRELDEYKTKVINEYKQSLKSE